MQCCQCHCPSLYVGKTTCPIRTWILEHECIPHMRFPDILPLGESLSLYEYWRCIAAPCWALKRGWAETFAWCDTCSAVSLGTSTMKCKTYFARFVSVLLGGMGTALSTTQSLFAPRICTKLQSQVLTKHCLMCYRIFVCVCMYVCFTPLPKHLHNKLISDLLQKRIFLHLQYLSVVLSASISSFTFLLISLFVPICSCSPYVCPSLYFSV